MLGEIPAMALIRGFDISDTPLDGEDMLLSDLPAWVQQMGFEVPASAGDYLDSAYAVYQMGARTGPGSRLAAGYRVRFHPAPGARRGLPAG